MNKAIKYLAKRYYRRLRMQVNIEASTFPIKREALRLAKEEFKRIDDEAKVRQQRNPIELELEKRQAFWMEALVDRRNLTPSGFQINKSVDK